MLFSNWVFTAIYFIKTEDLTSDRKSSDKSFNFSSCLCLSEEESSGALQKEWWTLGCLRWLHSVGGCCWKCCLWHARIYGKSLENLDDSLIWLCFLTWEVYSRHWRPSLPWEQWFSTYQAPESSEEAVKTQIAGPHLQNFWFSRFGVETPKYAFLTNSLVMLMLLVQGSHFEN